MNPIKSFHDELYKRQTSLAYRGFWHKLHMDIPLLSCLLILVGFGLMILYSAVNENSHMIVGQASRLSLAFVALFIIAQIPPRAIQRWTPLLFSIGLTLLLTTLIIGIIGKGAQRWLGVGLFRFQPSEMMKIAVPLMIAWYLGDKSLPPKTFDLMIASLLIIIPMLLTAKQPDLGTALMIACAGFCVLLFAGLQWQYLVGLLITGFISFPIVWHNMHEYQKLRVLTFLNPERDPLGTGYHIIQSKIAIGSGGLFGKGWLNGTQSHLHFLPEHATDFIFAVCGEEFGLLGGALLISLYLAIVLRGLYIASTAQDTYTRLVAGSLSLTFFFSVFVNIGMVTGILPVVGLPLPLISYGGTSMVTLLAGFGIIMSIHTHRRLVSG